MRKNILLLIFVSMLILVTGCTSGNKVKVYEGTEEIEISHEEKTITAVITKVDLEHNVIGFVECIDGTIHELMYHSGVPVLNTYGDDVGFGKIGVGSIVDALYYVDTGRLVSITQSSSATVVSGVNKFSIDLGNLKAKYKGTSCNVSEHVLAFDEGNVLDVMEINTEDQVTLNFYGGKLMSVVVEIGHGYVRLKNQDTYVGGMVEIGYDVIVPVTSDMLLAVREGTYTLRINKGSYSNTKTVQVVKNQEVEVDLLDIAVPMGTATFNITPMEAVLSVDGQVTVSHAYTNLYGSYDVKITADGYKTFRGKFQISEPVKVFTINLVKLGDDEEESTGETSEESTESGSTEDTSSEEGESSTDSSTEESQKTDNVIKVNAPIGAGVYVDGEYIGVAPISFPKTVGTHTIILYQQGYLVKSYTIQATDDGKDDEYSFAALTSLLDMIE